MAGVPGFGQGGQPNALPSRGRPEYGTNTTFRDAPDDWVGGARGPSALPSRTTVLTRPAPSQPLRGANGTISNHRGAYIEDAGAPRVEFSTVLGHMGIAWSRPTYANIQGLLRYNPPTQMPSWTANADVVSGPPTAAIPSSNKRIGSFTVRGEYGQTRQFFANGSLAEYVASIKSGMTQQGRRWLRQAKTHNPWLPNLSSYGAAGSYGQTTTVLPTRPTNAPSGTPSMGSY